MNKAYFDYTKDYLLSFEYHTNIRNTKYYILLNTQIIGLSNKASNDSKIFIIIKINIKHILLYLSSTDLSGLTF